MFFKVRDEAHPANVVSATDHHNVPNFEFHEVQDLAGGDTEPHRVIHLHFWVRVTQRTAIMSDRIWACFGANEDLLDAAHFVFSFIFRNLVYHKSALGVIQEAEEFLGFLNLHNIHETCRVKHVSPGLAVHLDEPLHDNHLASNCSSMHISTG